MVPLLDAHQHLVYPERQRYAWTDRSPALAGRTFALDDYRRLTAAAGVGGTHLHGGRRRGLAGRGADGRGDWRGRRGAASSG